MKWDIHQFKQCESHGHFSGFACPFCDLPGPPRPSAAEPMPEAQAGDRTKWFPGPEKELHDQFETWLNHHEVEYVHGRTDQKSTIESGWPDFTCLKTGSDGITRACLVEFKNRNGNLRKDQVEVIARHKERNIPVLVTGDFLEACDFVKDHLAIGNDTLVDKMRSQLARALESNAVLYEENKRLKEAASIR